MNKSDRIKNGTKIKTLIVAVNFEDKTNNLEWKILESKTHNGDVSYICTQKFMNKHSKAQNQSMSSVKCGKVLIGSVNKMLKHFSKLLAKRNPASLWKINVFGIHMNTSISEHNMCE